MDVMKRAADMVVSGEGDFRIHVDAYTDAEVFDFEMERIFSGWWVYVAHTSEIVERGDYKTTFMGRQPVIVSRDRDGEVRVLLNVCRHRGNAVCREEYGNSMAFRCPYHGWTYANDGRLIGVSGKVRYPEGFVDDIAGLVPAASVGIYRGLIFATLSDDAPSFDEYIAPVAKYIDLWADVSVGEEFHLERPFIHDFRANWKLQMENTSDGYHTRATHESAIKAVNWDPEDPEKTPSGLDEATAHDLMSGGDEKGNCTRDLGGGHGLVQRDSSLSGILNGRPSRFLEAEGYFPLVVEEHGEERSTEILRQRHILIYPNLYLLNHMVRQVLPVAADRTVARNHYTTVPAATEKMNLLNSRTIAYRLGATGLFNSDDLEMFVGVQTGAQARRVEWLNFNRGMNDEYTNDAGEIIGGPSDEATQRGFWKQWRAALAGEAANQT